MTNVASAQEVSSTTPVAKPAATAKTDYYRQLPGGYGYYVNSSPTKEVQELRDQRYPGKKVIVSEHLAYGLLKAVNENDPVRFNELLKTVYALSIQNFRETDRSTNLLPWLTFVSPGQNPPFQIASNAQHPRYGNASAADADIDLLTALIRASQRGWGGNNLNTFIELYAQQIMSKVVSYYPMTREGKPSQLMVLSKGGLIRSEQDEKGFLWDQFYLSYPNIAFLRYIANYFSPTSVSEKLSRDKDLTAFFNKFPSKYTYAKDGTLTVIGPMSDEELTELKKYFTSERDQQTLTKLIQKSKGVASTNLVGNPVLYKQFHQLADDSLFVIEKYKEKFGKHCQIPAFAEVSVQGKDIVFRNQGPIDPDDNTRLHWRTHDDDFLQSAQMLAERTRKPQNSYYYLLASVATASDPNQSDPIKRPFHHKDLSAFNDSTSKLDEYRRSVLNVVDAPVKHYHIDLQNIDAYRNPEKEFINPDYSMPSTPQGMAYYRAPESKPLSALAEQISLALKDMNSSPSYEKGRTSMERIIVSQLQHARVDTTFFKLGFDKALLKTGAATLDTVGELINSPWLKKGSMSLMELNTDNAEVELVSHYLRMLKQMSGFTDKQLRIAINRLVATCSAPDNTNNAMLKALYLEKILLWDVLLPEERIQLKAIADKFDDLKEMCKFMENKYRLTDAKEYSEDRFKKRQYDYTTCPFRLTINGTVIDSKTATLYQIHSLPISENLKVSLGKEIIKRDIENFFMKPYKDSETRLKDMKNYLKGLPESYKSLMLSGILYSSVFSLDQREKLILSELNDLVTGFEKKRNEKKFITKYMELYQAYEIILFQRHSAYVEDYIRIIRNSPNKDFNFIPWKDVLNKMHTLHQIITPGGNPSKVSSALLSEFQQKFDRQSFLKLKSTGYYQDIMTQTIGTSYWVHYHLSDLQVRFQKDVFPETRTQEKYRVGTLRDNFNKTFKTNLQDYYLFTALDKRMDIEKAIDIKKRLATPALTKEVSREEREWLVDKFKADDKLKEILELKRNAFNDRKDNAYAETIFAEATLRTYFKFKDISPEANKLALYQIAKDPVFTYYKPDKHLAYDYIDKYVKDMIGLE